MAYKEPKLPKGAAGAIFSGLNDNFVPKGVKDKHADKKGNPAKTGSKKPKIH